MFSPCWVVFKACRTRLLCGAAHVSQLKLERTFFYHRLFHSKPVPCSHTCTHTHTYTNTSSHSPTHHTVFSHSFHTLSHSHTHMQTYPILTKLVHSHEHTPLPSTTVYIKAVSNCTLSLIGSTVQWAAVDNDKSSFQSLKNVWPVTAMSEDRGEEEDNCPLAGVQLLS